MIFSLFKLLKKNKHENYNNNNKYNLDLPSLIIDIISLIIIIFSLYLVFKCKKPVKFYQILIALFFPTIYIPIAIVKNDNKCLDNTFLENL
tara:strand:+ start:702 stop:974 length:273 start_codon:yes stop_codon:yes gene_type:complete